MRYHHNPSIYCIDFPIFAITRKYISCSCKTMHFCNFLECQLWKVNWLVHYLLTRTEVTYLFSVCCTCHDLPIWNLSNIINTRLFFIPVKLFWIYWFFSFKQFVANLEDEIGSEKSNMEVDQISGPCAAPESSKDEISLIIKDLLNSSDRSIKSKALDRYRATGEKFYEESCQMDEKIRCFEKKIFRRYFDTTPLADDQLNNWHLYLDFIENLDNLDWVSFFHMSCFCLDLRGYIQIFMYRLWNCMRDAWSLVPITLNSGCVMWSSLNQKEDVSWLSLPLTGLLKYF